MIDVVTPVSWTMGRLLRLIRERTAPMPLVYDIEIEVSGKEHTGKTTLVAYLSKLLTDAGVELILQRADPQIDQKLDLSLEELRAKLAGKKVFLREHESSL